MSVSCLIAIDNSGKPIDAVYCHWNGDINNSGLILYRHYNSEASIRELISHGELRTLGTTIGEKHPIDKSKVDSTQCTFYHRDGDQGMNPKIRRFRTLDAMQRFARKRFIEWIYFYDGSKWTYSRRNLKNGVYVWSPFYRLSQDVGKAIKRAESYRRRKSEQPTVTS